MNDNVGDMPLEIFGDYVSDCLNIDFTWEYIVPMLSHLDFGVGFGFGFGIGYNDYGYEGDDYTAGCGDGTFYSYGNVGANHAIACGFYDYRGMRIRWYRFGNGHQHKGNG